MFLFSSCANHHFRIPAGGPPPTAPRFVDLLVDKRVATVHFPAGRYSFYALDDVGLYYRAQGGVFQHTGGGSVRRNGGVFVSKRHRGKLRGYIFLAGALTHIGDLSHTPHEFHN